MMYRNNRSIFKANDQRLTPKEREEKNERTIKNLHCALQLVQLRPAEKNEASASSDKNLDEGKQNTHLENTQEGGTLKTEQLFIGNDESATNRKPFYFGMKKLLQLESKEPTEILLSLDDPQSGFMELLNSDSISPKMTALLLKVFSKICTAKEVRILASLINKIVSESCFVQKHLQQYMIHLQLIINVSEIDVNGSLEGMLSFLSKFQQIQPVTSSEILTYILPAFSRTLEKLRRFTDIRPHIYEKLEALQSEKDSVIEEYDGRERKKMAESEQIHSKQPPEDYRTIPVLPSKEDFTNKRPFLRPNIVRGSYIDATHYLDVQFRLLREDYVRPLRESVETYKSSANEESKRISVYKNVQVLCPFNTEGGLVHLISFDPKPFVHIRWEVSKRFLLGSLLCLSCDNFESMLFATVAKRDPEELRKGRLEVHFEQLNEQIFSISPSASFVMVESEAYFEAFCHTLTSLQKMNEATLPLKDYIVSVNKIVEAPKYLKPCSSYNFSSTFDTLRDKLAEEDTFPVLNTENWPSHEDLGLDDSQYAALKAALTKEFAIIQGPPGTGKTYIGLKITQMLIENSNAWRNQENSPILVVCYTNHALDQFLEGILSFTNSIVRIGGRSSSEALKQYRLGELRQTTRKERRVPSHIYCSRQEVMKKVCKIEHYISHYTTLLEQSTQHILPYPFLQPFMTRRHSKFFESPLHTFHKWLCIPNNLEMVTEEKEENESHVGDAITAENEDDFDFELGLREVDSGEYSHANPMMQSCSEWITMKRSNQRNHVRKQILSWDMMAVDEARRVRNLLKMKLTDRWRLYRLWVVQYIENLLEIITHLQKTYHDESEKLRELRAAEDKLIIKKANIVGMTTTGAGKYHEYLQELQPQIVIVEEAAEVLEAHIVTSLTSNTQHLILIGDHQQLKPSPTVYELASRYKLDTSLFERMVNNGMSYFQLSKQHRMRPSIAKLLTPHIYRNLENHHSVEEYENILGIGSNMFFINHCFHEANVVDTKSHSNVYEASFLISLCKYLRLQGYSSSSITILTTYSGQLFTIRQLMKGQKLLEGVHVTVVDNFQGEENDIILISFVRSNDEGSIGFLKVSNRVCVALSRAKKGLYCIGNFELFAEESKLWKNIVHYLEEQKAIGTSLTLCCQNHPDKSTKITTANDFATYAPDGGCLEPCNFRMGCGHVCSRLCHPHDRSHTELECRKKCDKILCDLNHKCPKLCYEECGKCLASVEKLRSICGHTVPMPCHMKPDEFHCPIPCNKKNACGHICNKQCYEECEPCLTKVKTTFDCDHYVMIPCYKGAPLTCPKPCHRKLACGHDCENECGISPCPPCEHSIEKLFPCGHKNEIKCCDLGKIDARCEEACERKMDCKHECKSECGHDGSCGPCDQPCKKTLSCSHRCVLKCHEVCPLRCEACKFVPPRVTQFRGFTDADSSDEEHVDYDTRFNDVIDDDSSDDDVDSDTQSSNVIDDDSSDDEDVDSDTQSSNVIDDDSSDDEDVYYDTQYTNVIDDDSSDDEDVDSDAQFSKFNDADSFDDDNDYYDNSDDDRFLQLEENFLMRGKIK